MPNWRRVGSGAGRPGQLLLGAFQCTAGWRQSCSDVAQRSLERGLHGVLPSNLLGSLLLFCSVCRSRREILRRPSAAPWPSMCWSRRWSELVCKSAARRACTGSPDPHRLRCSNAAGRTAVGMQTVASGAQAPCCRPAGLARLDKCMHVWAVAADVCRRPAYHKTAGHAVHRSVD